MALTVLSFPVHLIFVNLLSWGFLKGNSRLKLGITSGFTTQSQPLGCRTLQTTRYVKLFGKPC
ncbi:MAG: hypothetical protein EWV81_07120 [Microcystis aeruginosa Ma_SC_T_19800800_S464]|jgi:hypothetical protein|uniref:Uncharacterized protein n=1 Tax=Microcystis aeruginosa Ma_SC_T_19800800_S464 TaxID=2486257 RepID=A0A552DZA7_MICAE|nr:MAG: hypothetical protein EWV81_07120 [Microcystis aeruginosa Ma_SC_T_19800800_S464]